MILDSSVVVAVVLREPGFEAIIARLEASRHLGIGAPTLVETGIVLRARLGFDPAPVLDRFLRTFSVVEIPFQEEHRREALDAFRRFGKGLHPAGLNYGDCLSYATARVTGQQLFFIGDDFEKTDIEPA